MKKTTYIFTVTFIVITLILAVSIYYSSKDKTTQGSGYSISLKNSELFPKDRICGFELTIDGGKLSSMPVIPFGWSVTINSDASWHTSVSGQLTVDSVAVFKDEIENMFVIEKIQNATIPLSASMLIYTISDSGQTIKHTINNLKLIEREGKSTRQP